MEHHKRHLRFYRFACFLLGGWAQRKFRITADPVTLPEGPNLILANHVSNYDPFFVALALGKQHTYFVCADNIMRKAWIRRFFAYWIHPIVQIKGKSGLKTVSEMLRRFKEGYNVAIFPEGNRTFNGRTGEMLPSIGKLAKKSGANLVLLRIEGAYFTEPRWGTTLRKGGVHVTPTVLTKEELKDMSVEEVTAAITAGTFTDAYEEQERKPQKYEGKHLCLGMEAGIYRCPSCGKISTLRSDDEKTWCPCGFTAKLDQYGYLWDGDENRHTVTEYMDAQRDWLADQVQKAGERGTSDFLFEDTIPLKTVTEDYIQQEQGEIHLMAYTDHVAYELNRTEASGKGQAAEATEENKPACSGSVTAADLEALAIFSRNLLTVFFPKDTTAYEMRGDISFNALKYRDLYEILKQKNN